MTVEQAVAVDRTCFIAPVVRKLSTRIQRTDIHFQLHPTPRFDPGWEMTGPHLCIPSPVPLLPHTPHHPHAPGWLTFWSRRRSPWMT